MEILEQFLRYSHILAGTLALLAGIVAMIAPKHQKIHQVIGKVYFYSMLWIFISAILMVTLVRFSLFLLLIGVFSFYLSFSGFRVMRRKRRNGETWLDWTAAAITLLAGLSFIGFGLWAIFAAQNTVLAILCLFFGLSTAISAFSDMRQFLQKGERDKFWWMYHHMQAMLGSYIAALTAFFVQIAPRLLTAEYSWLAWVLPAIIGSPLISIWVRRIKSKYA